MWRETEAHVERTIRRPQSNLWMTAAPAELLSASNLTRDPGSEVLSYIAPEFLTHRNYEIIHVCSLKPLKFGGYSLCGDRSLITE